MTYAPRVDRQILLLVLNVVLLGLSADPARATSVGDTVAAFNLDQREADIQALISRYGDQYVTGQADLALVAEIRSLLREAAADPSNSDSLNNQALDLMEELADRTPPWLYGNLTPIPDRIIYVDDPTSYSQAIVRSEPGDEIVIKNGFYEFVKNLDLNGTVVKPIIVRAETPGGVQFYGTSQLSFQGSNFIVEGLVLRETNGSGIMIYGNNVRATQCVVMGGSDASWFSGSNLRMDHMYWGAGTARVRRFHLPGGGSNRFGKNILDSDFFGTRRFQPGNDGLNDEMIFMNTNTDGRLRNNPYVHIVNSLIDGWYGEGDMAIKGGIQMFNSTAQDVPNQLIGHSCENVVFEGNYFFNQFLRMPACLGRVFTNNYMDGGWIDYEKVAYTNPQSDLTMSNNTLVNIHYWTRYISGLPAFSGTITNNLTIGMLHKMDGAYDTSGWTQEGNVTNVSIPSLGAGWAVESVAMQQDQFGVMRPTAPVLFGFQRTDPPYTNYDKRIAPSYLPASVRANRTLVSDYSFDADLATGKTSSTAESRWGIVVRHLTMYANGQPADLHSKAGMGVSGSLNDFSFDNTGASSMGSSGGVAVSDSLEIGESRGFTILGWFKTTGEPIGKGAVLFESGDVTVSAEEQGTLQLALGSTKVSSPAAYRDTNTWIFFAVTFEGCDVDQTSGCPKHVSFYKGGRQMPVTLQADVPVDVLYVSMDKISIGAMPDGSAAFCGLLDDFKLYAGTLSDPWGPGDFLRRSVASPAVLEEVRQNDLLSDGMVLRLP